MPGGEIDRQLASEFRRQSTTIAIASMASEWTPPHQELPPALEESQREWFREIWKKIHPEAEEPQEPAVECDPQLGPWNVDIRFSGGLPVGGWSQITLRQDGTWNFNGHLHDSGAPSYTDAVVWMVKNNGTGEVYQFVHTGRMHGTFEAGSRNDDWGESGSNVALASGWQSLCEGGASWVCRSGVNIDANSMIDAAKQAIGAAASIIAMI